MSQFFTPEQIAALSATTVRCDILIKLEFKSGTVYYWNGNTPLYSGGQTWAPTYGAAQIDGLSVPTGTASTQVTLTLNGLPNQATDLLAKALESTPEVQQQPVTLLLQLFDDEWQPVGAPIPFWVGFMQPPRITRTQQGPDTGAIQSITVAAENAFFNRSRPPYGRYTDRDQQSRSPGDKFFQFAPSLLFKTFIYPDY